MQALKPRLAPIALGLVVAIAVVVRLGWVLAVTPLPYDFDDAYFYDFFAKSLAAGDGYRMPWGTPTAFWPPGYPAVLAVAYGLFGHAAGGGPALNIILGAATVVLTYALARTWFGQGASLLAASMFALLPGAIGFTSLTLSETLFTLTLTAALLVIARAPEGRLPVWWFLAAVLTIAAATYIRGPAALLPLVIVPWLLAAGHTRRDAVRAGGLVLAGVALLAIPWAVRNTLTFDSPVLLSTNMGVNLWLGHHEGADGSPQFQHQLAFAGQYAGLPQIEQEVAWNREGLKQAVDFAFHHPADELELAVRKVLRLYQDDSDSLRWNERNGERPIFSAAERNNLRTVFDYSFYAVLGLALVALAAGLATRQPWSVQLGAVVAYWTAVHVVFFADPRYHAPLLPVLSILAAAAVASFAAQAPRPGHGRGSTRSQTRSNARMSA